jgi:murein DD-endopeptidase MepM/ murein hydrolase activator NlpD
MLEERFRIMYLGKEGTDLKQLSLGRKHFYFTITIISCILLFFTTVLMGLFTRTYHNIRITLLEKDRAHLQKELLTMKERISTISEKIATVEKTGDALRNASGLPAIDKDVRQVGVGGPLTYSALDFGYYPDEVGKTAQEIKVDLDKFDRELLLELTSLDEIYSAIKCRNDSCSHFPSINPILGGIITSSFGLRIDPLIGKIRPHNGVDIPMPVGTKVLAAADGVVKEAKWSYIPYRDYGREVIIDHGYGLESRYAHLSNILVRAGQRVKRWDVIGEVGQTGKATGPHLHYEVMREGQQQNPYHFMLDYDYGKLYD